MPGFKFNDPRMSGGKIRPERQAGKATGKMPKMQTNKMEGEGGFIKKEKLSKPYNKMK